MPEEIFCRIFRFFFAEADDDIFMCFGCSGERKLTINDDNKVQKTPSPRSGLCSVSYIFILPEEGFPKSPALVLH